MIEGSPFIPIPEGVLIMTGSKIAPVRFQTLKSVGGLRYRGDEYHATVDLAREDRFINKYVVVVGKSALRLRPWLDSSSDMRLANPGVTWHTHSVHWPYNGKTGYNDPGEASQASMLSDVELIVDRQWSNPAMRDMIEKMIAYAEMRAIARRVDTSYTDFKHRESLAADAFSAYQEHKKELDDRVAEQGAIADLFGGLRLKWTMPE